MPRARLPVLMMILLLGALGCTNTQNVVDSWKGQPIQAVVAQWGPPGHYETSHGPAHHPRSPMAGDQHAAIEQPIAQGPATYTWHHTTHHFSPARIETTQRKCADDRYITTTRFIPARWSTHINWFSLNTDDQSRVVSGRSSYQAGILPIDLFFEKRWGWASPRQQASR